MYKLLLILFLGSLISTESAAQQKESPKINWLPFEEAVSQNTKNPKKIFLEVYTNWCSWCRVMDKKTLSDPKIAAYVNAHFYAVKFNAEEKRPVTFMANTYNFNHQSRAHELAIALLQGNMSYPSTAYMDGSNQVLTVVPGYLSPKNFFPILVYFGDDHYLKMTWEAFQKEWPAMEKKLPADTHVNH